MRGIPLILALLTIPAFAGMTVITLTDAARARLDVLSFFIAAYLFLGLAVKALWNSLSKSFPKMPRLTYRQALALLLLSGLFLYVILTMISGARELLTPGAWEKQGIGYRVRADPSTSESREERRKRLEELRDALWRYAETHDGAPPLSPFSGEIPRERWRVPGGYLGYRKPEQIATDRAPIVYEPASAGPRRYVLLNDGSIVDWSEGKLNAELEKRWNP
ncbi:hypothetical protein [Haloferula sargassicola]|uniref:Type II secretion system protein GspG C-terminal domain-containing protein n=1 Tax=Haloferula sargassicola TaxID=490096 RepID=A0ABP9URY0_9BACT